MEAKARLIDFRFMTAVERVPAVRGTVPYG